MEKNQPERNPMAGLVVAFLISAFLTVYFLINWNESVGSAARELPGWVLAAISLFAVMATVVAMVKKVRGRDRQ